MSALGAVQIAGDDVHGAEVVRLENHVDTETIGLQVREQRSGDPTRAGQNRVVFESDEAWAVARQVREEEPWLRCEGGGRGKGKTNEGLSSKEGGTNQGGCFTEVGSCVVGGFYVGFG
jgi:hypothetical protein